MLTKLGRTLTAQDAGTTESWMDQLHNSCIANQIVQGCRFHSSGHGCLSVELEDGQLTSFSWRQFSWCSVMYYMTVQAVLKCLLWWGTPIQVAAQACGTARDQTFQQDLSLHSLSFQG